MNFLYWLKEHTMENIPLMFFTSAGIFMFLLIFVFNWLLYKGIL